MQNTCNQRPRISNALRLRKNCEGPLCSQFISNMASCFRLVSTNSRTSFLRSRLGTRNVHGPIPLQYPIAGGLGKFLPPAALQTLVEYQDGLLSRLNEEVRGMSINLTIIGVYDIIPPYSRHQTGKPCKCCTNRNKLCHPTKEDASI